MKKRIEFDLQKAINGAKVVCRNGEYPSEWHYFETDKGTHPVKIVINGVLCPLTKKGKCFERETEHPFDLFIEVEYTYEAVHCESQEQWDFVCEKVGNRDLYSHFRRLNRFGAADCINIIETSAIESKQWYESNNGYILTFAEWCERFGHKFNPKPVVKEIYLSFYGTAEKYSMSEIRYDHFDNLPFSHTQPIIITFPQDKK